MSTHVHRLTGCRPDPLAHYLKALGVLRLVATQADERARGAWHGDTFLLYTTLSADEIALFFLSQYEPTPLVAPWNGGSGFYEKDNQEGIRAIRQSTADRFSSYRAALALATRIVGGSKEAPKNEPKFGMQRALRRRADGPLAEWLDAVVVFGEDGSPSYPALLGTGGNDGRLDFTNNFMQRLTELFDCADATGTARSPTRALLEGALWNVPVETPSDFAIGQFLPGAVGGANSGFGFRGDPAINPWDFVLMLEGAVTLHPSAIKQLDSADSVQAGAPFAFRSSAVGYASSSDSDEGARGEQWMPLWTNPATFGEVRNLFAEGRAQMSRGSAQRPLEFARAVARLGVARGVTAFQRFGYIERNGQSNLAVPLGRWRVSIRAHQDLVDNVADWVDRLRAAARGDGAPASMARAARRCESALLDACSSSDSAMRWQNVLRALGEAERALVRSPRFTAERYLRPLPTLVGAWLKAAADDSTEWRVAVALASLHGVRIDDQQRVLSDRLHPLRRYALPLNDDKRVEHARFAQGESGLAVPPHVVMRGVSLVADLGAMLLRHTLDATGTAAGSLGLLPARSSACATLADLDAFVHGDIDDERTIGLLWPLLALSWNNTTAEKAPPQMAPHRLARFALLRTAAPLAPSDDAENVLPRLDPAMLRALLAGQVARASDIASRRLLAVGLLPKLGIVAERPAVASRWLAALAIPLSTADTNRLTNLACRPRTSRNDSEGASHD